MIERVGAWLATVIRELVVGEGSRGSQVDVVGWWAAVGRIRPPGGGGVLALERHFSA